MTIIFTKCDKQKNKKKMLEEFQKLIREYFQEAPPWIMTSRDDIQLHMAQLRNYWLKN